MNVRKLGSIDTIVLGYPVRWRELSKFTNMMNSGLTKYENGIITREIVWGELKNSADYRIGLRLCSYKFPESFYPEPKDYTNYLRIEYSVPKFLFGNNGLARAFIPDVYSSYLAILKSLGLRPRSPKVRRIDIGCNIRVDDPSGAIYSLKSCIFPNLTCSSYGTQSVNWGGGRSRVYAKCYDKQLEQATQSKDWLVKILGEVKANSYLLALQGTIRWEFGLSTKLLQEMGINNLGDLRTFLDIDSSVLYYIQGILAGTMGKRVGQIIDHNEVEKALTYTDKLGRTRVRTTMMGFWLQLRELGVDGMKQKYSQTNRDSQFYRMMKNLREYGVCTSMLGSTHVPSLIPISLLPSENNLVATDDFNVYFDLKKVGT